MAADNVFETLQDKFSHIILGTTLFGALSFAIFPWLSSSLFLAASIHLLLNLNQSELFEYDFNFALDVGTAILFAGLLFSFSNIFAHLLVGGLAYGGLSALFISEYVLTSRQPLPDKDIEFSSIFNELRHYAQNPFLRDLKNWVLSLKTLRINNSQQNKEIFYEASTAIWESLRTPFNRICENVFQYLQQQTRENEPLPTPVTANNDPVINIDLSDHAPTMIHSLIPSASVKSTSAPDEDPSIISANRKSNAI